MIHYKGFAIGECRVKGHDYPVVLVGRGEDGEMVHAPTITVLRRAIDALPPEGEKQGV